MSLLQLLLRLHTIHRVFTGTFYECMDGEQVLVHSTRDGYYCSARIHFTGISRYAVEQTIINACNKHTRCTGYDYNGLGKYGHLCMQTEYPGSSLKCCSYKLCRKSEECPQTHPYAYYNGDHCCATNSEKTYVPQGSNCDGSHISITSLCCLGGNVRCPLGKCRDRKAVVISVNSSSVYEDNNEKWGPQLAWDGASSTDQGFFHSKREHDPWFKTHVHPVTITRITIINRKDGSGQRFRNIEVRAGLSSELFGNDVVGAFKGPGFTGGKHIIPFNRPVLTEYITIQLKANEWLQINGIRVNEFASGKQDKKISHFSVAWKITCVAVTILFVAILIRLIKYRQRRAKAAPSPNCVAPPPPPAPDAPPEYHEFNASHLPPTHGPVYVIPQNANGEGGITFIHPGPPTYYSLYPGGALVMPSNAHQKDTLPPPYM